jgi:hypothetical protein
MPPSDDRWHRGTNLAAFVREAARPVVPPPAGEVTRLALLRERFQLLRSLRRQRRLWLRGRLRPTTLAGREGRRRPRHLPALLQKTSMPRGAVEIPLTRWPAEVWEEVRRAEGDHEQRLRLTCACGDAFESPEACERHLRSWMPSWHRVRFRYLNQRGERIARTLPGCRIRFEAEAARLTCSCGWSASEVGSRPGPIARDHVRAVCRRTIRGRQAS